MGYRFFIDGEQVEAPDYWPDPMNWGMPSDLMEQWKRQDKKKIRIATNQPINTSGFEEADVIEYLPHGN